MCCRQIHGRVCARRAAARTDGVHGGWVAGAAAAVAARRSPAAAAASLPRRRHGQRPRLPALARRLPP